MPVKGVMLELTNLCNAHCPYCYNRKGLEKSWNLNELKKISRKLIDKNFRLFSLSGGEPFLYPHLVEYLKWLHKLDVKIIFASNGLVTIDNFIDVLKETGSSVQFTLDSVDKDTYIMSRGVDGLSRVLKTIDKCKEADLDFTVAITINSYTIKTLDKTLKFCADNEIDTVHVSEVKGVGKAKDNYSDLELHPLCDLYELLYKYQKKYSPHVNIDFVNDILVGYLGLRDIKRKYYCNALCGNLIQIDPFGNVYMCENIPDKLLLGNLLNDSIEYILTQHENKMSCYLNNSTKCDTCENFHICRGGCRAYTYAKTGSFFAVHPRCNEMLNLIEHIRSDEEKGVITNLLFMTELNYLAGNMNGFSKWV
ncbi:MAG: radical SAM protein [Pseudomonadota bacterium]